MAGKSKEVVSPSVTKANYDHSAPPIEDVLEELARKIPQEEWKRLPDDLSDNLDHYLYGIPRK